MRTPKQFSAVEVVIVAVVLGALSMTAFPKFSKAGTDDRLNALCDALQSVRSQITLYSIQHDGRWPVQATFAEQMTGKTNANGTTDPAEGPVVFGPYLQYVPANPFTGGNAVAGGDWSYDEKTGRFTAGDSGITRGIRHKDL